MSYHRPGSPSLPFGILGRSERSSLGRREYVTAAAASLKTTKLAASLIMKLEWLFIAAI